MTETVRELDLVLFGATGFTGRLVAEFIATKHAGLRWALGGRSRDKLERVRAELIAKEPSAKDVAIVVADSLDPAAMADVARRARVVCSTVGPYALYGAPLVAACAEFGTAYCDLTGEVDWMRGMIDAHHARAMATGARIVPACGFDSIPSDLGVLVLGAHLRDRGRQLVAARLRVVRMKGGVSGGTFASGLAMAERAGRDRETRRILADPYALNPEGERTGPDRSDKLAPHKDAATGHWLAPFVMAGTNTRVVRRSHALSGFPHGRDFRYEEVSDMGAGVAGYARATAMSAALGAFVGAAALGPTRRLLARVVTQPGSGPSEEKRKGGSFGIVIDGTADDGSVTHVRVEADKDPGYGATAIMLGQSALALCEPLEGVSRGGLLTPATAPGLGLLLVDRLRAEGFRFEVSN